MTPPEFRSKIVQTDGDWDSPDKIEKTCNEWAKEGFEVFSVICPQPSNYTKYRLTAVRYPAGTQRTATGRKFR